MGRRGVGYEGGGDTGAQVRLRLKRQEENKKGPERVALTGDGERGLDEGKQREMKGSKDLGLLPGLAVTPWYSSSALSYFSLPGKQSKATFLDGFKHRGKSVCAQKKLN